MSRLRKAALATVVAQAFSWAGLLLSLVTIPLYLEWLGQERYGVLLTGLAFASYLMFTDVGLTWGAMLLIAQANGRDDQRDIQGIVRTSFSMAALSGTVVVTIVLACYWMLTTSALLSAWFPVHPESPGLLLAVGASVVCNLMISPFYNVFSGLQETHLSAIYQGAGRLLGTAGSVVMAYSGATLGWVFSVNVLAALTVGTLAAVHCYRRHPWAFREGPFWEAGHVRRQLRTGGRTFGMQVGNVMWGTAPVLAISSAAGPQFVPMFSIPMSLLNAPLGVLNSLNASMQAGYGEAMGRGEREWVSHTVQRILQQVLMVLGLLGCGFLLLAAPFVQLWTGGKIELERPMLLSVLSIACAGALLGVFRFALTGTNQHRRAAASELLCGPLAIVLAIVFVRQFGPEAVGLAIIISTCLTSGWLLPRELRSALGQSSGFWPSVSFVLRWAMTVCCTYVTGWTIWESSGSLPPLLEILISGSACVLVFFVLAHFLLQPQVVALRHAFRLVTRR